MIRRFSLLYLLVFACTGYALERSPERIVTLAPSLGEIVADLLPENEHSRLIAVSEYTDYPTWTSRLPSIGPFSKVSLEKIISLHPDLVIATQDGNSKDQLDHLRELGIKTVVVNTQRLSEAMDSWKTIASHLDATNQAERKAEKWVQNFKSFLSAQSKMNLSLSKKRVAIQVSLDPIVMAGDLSFIHDLISTLGVVNVYGDSHKTYLRPSVEDVSQKKPDYIIFLAMQSDSTEESKRLQKQWAHLKKTKLVVSSHAGLLRPTLRMHAGIQELSNLMKNHEAR